MFDLLINNEMFVADNGNKNHQYVTPADFSAQIKAAHVRLGARH